MMRIEIGKKILEKNEMVAASVRGEFQRRGMTVLNMISSPGSGKTSLLEQTLPRLQYQAVVIEGDVSTQRDADRIRRLGFPAVQIETMGGCHLDATMVRDALPNIPLPEGGFLFIENVGNLVCPSSYDLGEDAKIVLLSVAEGDDKPMKYPSIFIGAKLAVLNKIDLLPYTDFDVEKFKREALSLNPSIKIVQVSCRTGEGIEDWLSWLNGMKSDATN